MIEYRPYGPERYKPYLHVHLSRNDKKYQELINNSFHIQLQYYKNRSELIDEKLQKQPDRGSRILAFIESMVLDFETDPSISRHSLHQIV